MKSTLPRLEFLVLWSSGNCRPATQTPLNTANRRPAAQDVGEVRTLLTVDQLRRFCLSLLTVGRLRRILLAVWLVQFEMCENVNVSFYQLL
jgi:hypothetical protein